jgi:tetratricopeptide (TPR) repeat protein
MGFGKKTDYASGRTLDLNKTYKNIIQPAVEKAGYECIRADEIQESSIIDKSMYAFLLTSNLVVADISTYNPNAIYELGIRHAVKPFSTIIIKEKEGKIPFDIDHSRIFEYTHLGEDIGADEAKRCITALTELIKKVEKSQSIDSPLYEYIKVDPPSIDEEIMKDVIAELAEKEDHIFAIIERAKDLMSNNEFSEAAMYWKRASKIVPTETYFIQQLALSTYKSKEPSEFVALTDALSIIKELNPDKLNNDPETLGITGAINKNLYLLNNDLEYLNRAIDYYGKGFKLRNDYYTGENYALCLNIKANIETDEDETIYYNIEAKKTRKAIIKDLEAIIEFENIDERPDKYWIYASLSNCYFALFETENSEKYKKLFLDEEIEDWERETFINSRNKIKEIIGD